MNVWKEMNPSRVKPDDFVAVIEISKAMKNKYELDKETGMLILDRVLFTSTHYPANYGFIPLTYADDNDPLDVLVLCSEPIEPLALVRCYPIGVMEMTDEGAIDYKVIAIPFGDPTYNGYNNIDELPQHISDEIQHFFNVYKTLEHKNTTVLEMLGRDRAIEVINDALVGYKRKFGN